MSKNGKVRPPLLALLICERAILDEDKVASLIRVIDTFTFRLPVQGLPQEQLDKLALPLQCVVFTRWGPGEGRFTQELRIVNPKGEEAPEKVSLPFQMQPGFHFQQFRINLQIMVKEPGLYKVSIYLDDQIVGEHPFMVNLDRRQPDTATKLGTLSDPED